MMIDAGYQWAAAEAPATVSQLVAGLDILGLSLDGPRDRVTICRSDTVGVRLVGADGEVAEAPEVACHEATAGLVALADDRGLEFGLEVRVDEGIARGAGLGGRAALAVAAVVAASAVLDRPLSLPARFRYAQRGVQRACGERRADQVAPAMLGGLMLVRSVEPLDVVRLPVPHQLAVVVVHPEVDGGGRLAGPVAADEMDRELVVAQAANVAALVAACMAHDLELMGRCLADLVIAPRWAQGIPGLAEVQAAALGQGALSCSITGAGPGLVAIYGGDVDGQQLAQAMIDALAGAGLSARAWVSPINSLGAQLVARGRAARDWYS